jgi:hypothetical protein
VSNRRRQVTYEGSGVEGKQHLREDRIHDATDRKERWQRPTMVEPNMGGHEVRAVTDGPAGCMTHNRLRQECPLKTFRAPEVSRSNLGFPFEQKLEPGSPRITANTK